jgi:hypothetical protein
MIRRGSSSVSHISCDRRGLLQAWRLLEHRTVSIADAIHAIVDPAARIAREVPPQSRMSQRGTATIHKAICLFPKGD